MRVQASFRPKIGSLKNLTLEQLDEIGITYLFDPLSTRIDPWVGVPRPCVRLQGCVFKLNTLYSD